MNNKGITAIILCGGRGERLRPLTNEIPKPLVKIKGRPILAYVLENLKKYKVEKIIIAAGYKYEEMREYFADKSHGSEVEVFDTGDADIIDRLKYCEVHIDQDFMVLYGDTIVDININSLYEYHLSHSKAGTISIWPFKSQYGLVEIDSLNNVLSFQEKPTLNKWINIGYFFFNKNIFSSMKRYDNFANFLEFLGESESLSAYKHLGSHITVNTLEELNDAEKNIDRYMNEINLNE